MDLHGGRGKCTSVDTKWLGIWYIQSWVLQADGIVARETSCYYGARQQRGILVVRQGCYSRDLQPPLTLGSKGACLLSNSCCLSKPCHLGTARHNKPTKASAWLYRGVGEVRPLSLSFRAQCRVLYLFLEHTISTSSVEHIECPVVQSLSSVLDYVDTVQ